MNDFAIITIVYAVAILADWYTTHAYFGMHGKKELGPLAKHFGPNAVLIGSCLVYLGLSWCYKKGFQYVEFVLWVLCCAHIIAALRNYLHRGKPAR